jgi:hypothetical protein
MTYQLNLSDILPRLKAGLQQYKSKHREDILDMMIMSDIFKNLSQIEVEKII